MRNKVAWPVMAVLVAASCLNPRAERPPTVRHLVLADDSRTVPRASHEARGVRYAIATQSEEASRAAQQMFHLGGNVFDAATAVSFVMAVGRPQSTGLGGGGFMLLHLAAGHKTFAVDFREKAPKRADRSMFLDKQGRLIPGLSTDGILAGAVPGMVAGVLDVHARFGRLPRQTVLQPAIELAERGFPIYRHLAKAIHDQQAVLSRFDSSKRIFFRPDGQPLAEGDVLKQPELSRTLQTIAELGQTGFYKGWVAEALLKTEASLGGVITQQDLDGYVVRWRRPLMGEYKGYQIVAMPPPSSGGVHVVEILQILGQDPLRGWGPQSAQTIHITSAAMQKAFADRFVHLGDSDFVSVPTQKLISQDYARLLRQQIPPDHARSAAQVLPEHPLPHESDETAHFSIMDREGNAVTSTQTINGYLGSGIVVDQAGFLLNNEMDDFAVKPGTINLVGSVGGTGNAIEPEKRPLSSMSPTLVFRSGQGSPVMAIGSPSGTRIISCVVLTILNYYEHLLPLYESVTAIRYHHQWFPDEIRVDSPSFASEVTAQLQSMGYSIKKNNLGCKIQVVTRGPGGSLHAVSDPQGEGLAIGE